MKICPTFKTICLIRQIYLILLSLCIVNSLKITPEGDELLVYSIKENSPTGTIIGNINSPRFPPPFEIHESQEKNLTINKENGAILVSDLLDREKREFYSFLIISSNGDTRNVKVNILDENDNAPKFNTTSLEKVIPENYPVNSKVDLTSVYDPDEGINSIQKILIVSGDPDGFFSVDFYNGGSGYFYVRLVLLRQLDFETTTQYNIILEAIDGGPLPLRASLLLKIIIENANDNAPKFDLSRYVASVREDQSPGDIVVQVRATDKDAGLAGQLTYFIDSNSVDSKLFAINPLTGDISLDATLDYERKRQLSFNVAVRDNVLPYHTSRTSVIVDVIDVNDNPPSIQVSFPQQRNEIDLNTEPNSLVAHITIIDVDSISSDFFLQITNDSPLKLDKILPKIWQLMTTDRLRSVTSDNITIVLMATDYPPPSLKSSTVVTIQVKRKKIDSMKFAKRIFISVLSSPVSGADENITMVAVSDRESKVEASRIYYSLTGYQSRLFKIDRRSGQISSATNTCIDCGEYEFWVSLFATKNTLPIDKSLVKVIVKGTPRYGLYFPEGFRRIVLTPKSLATHDCPAKIIVGNRHCNMHVKYEMETLLKDTADYFKISSSGAICLSSLSQAQLTIHKTYFFKISASEINLKYAFTNVLLISTPSPNDLRLGQKYIRVNPDPLNRSVPVARVTATFMTQPSHPYYGVIEYRLKARTMVATNLVKIDPITGHLYLLQNLIQGDPDIVVDVVPSMNQEEVPSQTTTVTLSMGYSRRFQKSLYEFYISPDELSRNEMIVGRVYLEPMEEKVIYHLTQSSLDEVMFAIDEATGVIRAQNIPLRSNILSLTVNAKWKDQGQTYAQVLVLIDTTMAPPSFHFTSLDTNIWENATIGTELVQVIPNEPSLTDHYEICYGRFSDWFSIHERSGQVFLRTKLDREDISRAILTVELKNKRGSVKTNININILDNNDNAPACLQSIVNVTLGDNAQIGYVTCPIQCSDADTADNGNLTYKGRLVAPNGVESPLGIQEMTGCIEVLSSLDIWGKNPSGVLTYSSIVSDNARDGPLFATVLVFVTIINTNNHYPFISSYPVFHVMENTDPGTDLGKVILDDDDKNEVITLHIEDKRYSKWFSIETVSGRISLIRTKDINGIPLGLHVIAVRIVDNGNPSQSSAGNVSVIVDDSNDHDPSIVYPGPNENVSFPCPLLPGSKIFAVKALDNDQGSNARLNYVIVDSDMPHVFVLERLTGVMVARQPPSCLHDTRLKILVHDMGYPQRSASLILYLSAEKVQGPGLTTLVFPNLTFLIPVNAVVGTIIGSLKIDLWDSLFGIKYLIGGASPVSPDGVLHIDYGNQELRLLRTDFPEGDFTYPITAIFHKAIAPPRSLEFQLRLQTQNYGSGWPILADDFVTIKVKENQPPGTIVKKFIANQSESDTFYSIRQPSDYFVINPLTGTLVTFISFDREGMIFDEFSIEVIASSVSNPRKSVVVPVHIVVEDLNDNSPTILSPVNTTIVLYYPDSRNNSVARVVAVDIDKGDNGRFIYSISGSSIFSIDALSGEMWLTGDLSELSYEVNVSVADMGTPSLSSWRLLTFLFRRSGMDNRIRFQFPVISMNLSTVNGLRPSILGRLTLANANPSPNPAVRFQLMAGNLSPLFEIDPVKGDIRLSARGLLADIGTAEIVKLSVVVYLVKDSSNYDIAQLLIHVDHGNNYSPSFFKSKYDVKLPEGEAITDFLTVAAHDLDLGVYGMISYRLLGDVEDKRITIDPNTGRLSCSSLSYRERKIYHLQVVAFDSFGGSLSKNQSASVRIEVRNSMKQNIDFNSSHFVLNLRENLPSGSMVGRITVQSRSSQSKVIYLLNPGNALLNINSSTGSIITNGPFDREITQYIDVTIHALSKTLGTNDIQSAKALVTIRIIDDNDNSPIPAHNPYIVCIDNLLSPVVSQLVTLYATDPDASSNISYQLDLQDTVTKSLSVRYSLDPVSGGLKPKLNYMPADFVQDVLRVVISDGGSPPRTTKTIVVITSQRRSRILNIGPEKAVFRLLENPSVGVFIGQIFITDNCTSGRVSFTVIDGIDKELVHLHAPTGKIFTSSTSQIDREKTKQIVLWTQAECLGTDLVGFKKIVIHIEDLDDNRPVFSQREYEAFVLEGLPPKTSVIRTMVYDPDEGINNQVEYFIEMYTPLDEFSIDFDGTIRTNIPLNFHTKSLYTLIVKATSKSTPLIFAECRVTVHVININDQKPLFSSPLPSIRISEDQTVGSLLTTITATDSDGSSGISYRIRPHSSSNVTRFLSIAYDSGEVFLSRRLGTSDVGQHDVEVVADDGKYTSSAILSVHVADVNNEIPMLLEDGGHYLVTETLGLGSIITYLHAVDRDFGINGQVTFKLYPDVPWLSLQEFGNNTAVLFLASQPTFIGKVLFVGIHLADKAIDPKHRLSSISTIALVRESSNLHSPSIRNGSRSILTLQESAALGSKVTSIQCMDLEDSVTYRINSSSSPSPFHIDPITGDIFLIMSLENYPRLTFEGTVTCEDDGKPQRRTTLSLTLNIIRNVIRSGLLIDSMKNITIQLTDTSRYPVFVGNVQNAMMHRLSKVEFTILAVVPVDGKMEYDLPAQFDVDSSANLWLNTSTKSSAWNILFKVTNKAVVSLPSTDLFHSSYARTTVFIIRTTSRRLYTCVRFPRLSAVIKENEPVSTIVLRLPKWYSDITYIMTDEELFRLSCSVYPTSLCVITTKTVLDFENNERFELSLAVSGLTVDKQSCSHGLVVSVYVLDVDEFAPVFSQSEYRYSVPGGTPSPGRVVFTVQATDADKGRFGVVYYQLEYNHKEHFAVRNTTGEIYIQTAFPMANSSKLRSKRSVDDGEPSGYQRKTFSLDIIASSGDKSTTVNVRLKILVPLIPDENRFRELLSSFQIKIIIGLLITVLIVVILVALVFIFRRRRCNSRLNNNEGSSTNGSQRQETTACGCKDTPHGTHNPVPDLIAMDNHRPTKCCYPSVYYDQSQSSHFERSSDREYMNAPTPLYMGTDIRFDSREFHRHNELNASRLHNNMSDINIRCSDSDNTSSSNYSSISRNRQHPTRHEYQVAKGGSRSMRGPMDYTRPESQWRSSERNNMSSSSNYIPPRFDSMELGPLRNMDRHLVHSSINIDNDNLSTREPLLERNQHERFLLSSPECQVISIHEPQPSSNRPPTSSDITDIDS